MSVADSSSTSLQGPLFCVFGGNNCNETMSLSDCSDVIVNRNYSTQNGKISLTNRVVNTLLLIGMMLYSRNHLLTSQVMFVNCSLPYE